MRIIAGESKGRRLKGVRRGATRPTMNRVRESMFAILTPYLNDARFLDLFAGVGSVGLEALSRGASEAVFVDASRACAAAIRENLALMGPQVSGKVLVRTWSAALNQLGEQQQRFRIIFADPPYRDEAVLARVGEKIAESRLIDDGGWMIFQHTVRLTLREQFGDDLARSDQRRFGETVLTFYHLGGSYSG